MTNKEKYRHFCNQCLPIPIFLQYWWLDAVCGEDNWDVVLQESNDNIIAAWPFFVKKKFKKIFITMPKLTQIMGPYIIYPPGQSSNKKLSYEKKIMEGLLSQMPKFFYFCQNMHCSIKNWLPLYWQGFHQTTRYTYVIDGLNNIDHVLAGFTHAKRKNIKKSADCVKVGFDLPADEFYQNHVLTLAKQGKKISYTYDLFKQLYDMVYDRGVGKTIYAKDSEGNIHAALFVIWDSCSAYDLISTIDPDYRNIGAASLLVYEIIKYISSFVNQFDFEGSMIEPVERSFRSFGAKQIPYFRVTKTKSRWFSVLQMVRGMR